MILDSAQGNALVQLDLSQIQREMPEGGAVVGPGGKTVLASLRKRGIVFLNREERYRMESMRDQIVGRVERLGEGKAFSAKDFLDIASRTTIDVTLAELAHKGTVRRIRRGLYDMPRVNPALGGTLSPDIDEAARAIARRQRWKIVPDGAWAANLLGLSTQVPSKIIYLTDGPNNEVPIGRRSIVFKHARPKVLAGLEERSLSSSRHCVISAKKTLGSTR